MTGSQRLAALLLVTTAGGCGGATPPNPPPPPPAGVISIAPSTGNASVQQGASAAITVLVLRAGGFTGAVTVSVEGLPAGVTAPQSNETTAGGQTTVTITFTAATSAIPGKTTLTLRAKGSGVVDATTGLDLTITAAPVPTYELTATGSPVSVPQGGNGQVTVTLARSGGFAASVALTIEGAPAGLSASFNPAATTGTTATLTIVAAAGLASGTYTLTIRGTAAGQPDKITTVQVLVTAVTASGNAVFDFSQCPTPYVVWAAFRDGNGPWTRVTPTAKVFRFTINSPLATFAYVIQQNSPSTTTVEFMTRAEISAAPFVFCPSLPINTKVVSGVVNGLTGSPAVFLNLGGSFAMASALFPTYNLVGVPNGDRDLVAYRLGGIPSAADRITVRRDLNIPTGGTVAPINFAAADSTRPAPATLTISGLAGEGILETLSYLTRASCDPATLYQTGQTSPSHLIFGVPPALQRPDDYHMIRIAAATATTSRTVQESFHAITNRTVTLGNLLGSPAVTVLPGNYKRLQATFGFPLEYTRSATLRYIQTSGTPSGAPRIVLVTATPGSIGSTTAVIAMPDFAGVVGWTDAWAPMPAAATPWSITGNGGNIGASSCGEGVRVIQVSASGAN